MIDPAEKSDIKRLEAILLSIQERLTAIEAARGLIQEWYTLRQAAQLKRGVEIRRNRKTGVNETFDSFYRTLCAKPDLRPHKGVADATIGGVAVWHRDTIRVWLLFTDEELETIRKAS